MGGGAFLSCDAELIKVGKAKGGEDLRDETPPLS